MARSTCSISSATLGATTLIVLIALISAQAPASGYSLMDQVPFANNFRGLLSRGSEVVDAIRSTASFAYNDISDSVSNLSLERVQKSLLDTSSQLSSQLLKNEIIASNRLDSSAGVQSDDANCNQLGQTGEDSSLCAGEDPDATRTVVEIIRSRGFLGEEHDVQTKDGYLLTIQRIINPLIDESQRRKLKPVILQHGLMSSSVDWVINSVDVRPTKWPRAAAAASGQQGRLLKRKTVQTIVDDDSQEQPNSLGFYLANEGYDVFLANSRGNIYGQRHVQLNKRQSAFWAFTWDEQIKYDLPDTIAFVQKLTGHTKVGYVGHSQGTTMALGLLADEPQYADIMEPVVLLAPVAYVKHVRSPAKYFSIYTPIFSHVNMPFANSNAAVRYLAPLVCSPKVIRRDLCANIVFLATGFDEAEFDMTRVTAFLKHMPSGTSVKNIAHWGQAVISGRFAHFDHGILVNQARYGQARAPDYNIRAIRSKSLALFAADNDWMSGPRDVAQLRAELQVPLAKWVNVTEALPAWNHIDFLYGKDCGRLVNARVVEVFHQFDNADN